MYVSTFYSFKGGVGRTMALVNVAVDLVQRGRRVLVVDFDLEAPGLDTFPVLRPKKPISGLVDYVIQYLESDQAPDVRDFVGESLAFENLSVMPSGAGRSEYATDFGQIDWGALYERRDGYLLFEDLKEQWRQLIEPEYVLIDSRTGYTDAGGICTRQLPDAVTVLFFPNEQHLRGLTKVVADIRSEANPPRSKEIQLHFVMSNVPDLDDEDDILTGMKEKFQQDLEFLENPLLVHHYNSLSLLNQAVFALERPKSRLSLEYRAVGNRIVRGNLADREGALYYIRQGQNGIKRLRHRDGQTTVSTLDAIKKIRKLHANDGEVLFGLGVIAAQRGFMEAEPLLNKAIECGYRKPEAYVERAQVRADTGDKQGASEDATAALGFHNLPPHLVVQATRLAAPDDTTPIEEFPAITGLDPDEQLSLARTLARAGDLERSTAVLERLVDTTEHSEEDRALARSELAPHHIEAGRFKSAVELLSYGGRTIDEMNIRDAFNYAMATWGNERQIAEAPFKRVLDLEEADPRESVNANFLQCLAVANWAAGEAEDAKKCAHGAREEAQAERLIFSCWRYRTVRATDFLEDVEEIVLLIDGDQKRVPRFMASDQETAM